MTSDFAVRLFAALSATLLATGVASAQQQQHYWRPASSAGDGRAFIDTLSIQRTGDQVRFLREIRFNPARQFDDGQQFDRLGAVMEFDCRAHTLRNISLYSKLGDRVITEAPSSSSDAEPIDAGTTAETDFRAVCLDQWPSD